MQDSQQPQDCPQAEIYQLASDLGIDAEALATLVALPGARRTKVLERLKDHARSRDHIGHLGPEAVVAFVDGEMDHKATHRVRIHLVHCDECRAEVHRQRGAAAWVRECSGASDMHAPVDLLAKLHNIASMPQYPGPSAEDTVHSGHHHFLDKVDLLLRTWGKQK
ncbi:anti-sigma factor family protein [Corynebacterium lizhenjunii]|uniref:anti-sigma factor family protein n=1 Tax=Corynebacterium lizhenjunii TaxID=2709394 RepID=UPI0013EC1C60|nr:anti-sigma factor [Corynebacterium lizhenjunii]